jgi:NADPH:quinone reductase-like Zn-dependent oxidoreductase
MKAVVHDRYGPPEVLRLEDVERPVPGPGEVVVRVRATTVNQTDCHMRRARPLVWRLMLGLRRPRRRTLGMELAGEVAAVGDGVTQFEVGDRVFGITNFGANAEFIRLKESSALTRMPAGLPFEEAAAIFDGAFQGLAALRRANVGEGTRLVVYGASGSCGTAAVQLGRHLGAHVTAVCNTKNVELVRSLGADVVLDYTREDFAKDGETYDVILDAVGKQSFFHCRRALRPGGLYVATDRFVNLVLLLWTRWFGKRRVVFGMPRLTKDNVHFVKELVESGRYRAVVDRTYPLEDVVEATRYVESWQKTGNVVLTV